jgi:hypothetical protein
MTEQPIKSKAESDVPMGLPQEPNPEREAWLEQIKKESEEEEKPAILSHLNLIENPALAGKPVVVEAVISSTSIAYLAPCKVKGCIKEEDQDPFFGCKDISEKDPVNVNLVGVNSETKWKRLERMFKPARVLSLEETAWRTVYLIRVRPPVFTLEKRGEKIVDEKGFEYKSFDIYVTTDKPIVFQPSNLVRFEGVPLPNPRTQKTTFLAYKVEFPEATQNFDAEKLVALKAIFNGKTVKERLDWVLENFEKFSQIVGRRNLATVIFLVYYTPTWVKVNHETQRGWGDGAIIGDTTTAKSETQRKVIWLLKAGSLVTAETASTVGLTGTATQVTEGWFVDWGFLPLMDKKLLAVDGAQKLSLSNWAALAEAERSGVVSIAKAAKDSAYARTRQVKIANAVDKEADKYSTKSLASFLYPCQALPTIFDKTSIARLDIVAFADQRDVNPEAINIKSSGEYDKNLELLSESLKWCWSDTAQIEFTDSAITMLLAKATELYNTFFCEMVPLASIDLKWKLARLSASLASLTLSTNDFLTVQVTEDHVKVVVDFITEEYSKAGLNILAQETKYEKIDLEETQRIILGIGAALNSFDFDRLRDILHYIVTKGRVTKDELTQKFKLAEKSEQRPLLAVLKTEGLLKIGRGFYPENKLIEMYKVSNGFTFEGLRPSEPLEE